MENKFRKIVKFSYKNNTYQLFMDRKNRLAFLKVINDTFVYPTIEELFELTNIWSKNRRIKAIKKDRKVKLYNFIPKVFYTGVLVTLSTSFLTGCGEIYSSNYPKKAIQSQIEDYDDLASLLPDDFSFESNTNMPPLQEEKESNDEVTSLLPADFSFDKKEVDLPTLNSQTVEMPDYGTSDLTSVLAPADDQYDNYFSTDYETNKLINTIYIRDAKALDSIFDYGTITLDDIIEVCNANDGIPNRYKDYIVDYVRRWLTLYPNSDMRVFYHNLKTMKINELTKEQMMCNTVSMDTVAYYYSPENTIQVLEDIDFEHNPDDWIILTHEFTHAKLGTNLTLEDGTKVEISFYDEYDVGWTAEEGLICDIVYQLQGQNKKSIFYTLQSSYFRIIMDCVDYTGEDFSNHSIYYLMKKMDEFMGDDEYAYHILSLIGAEGTIHYTPYVKVDYNEFSELYDYITRMYMKKHLRADMSYEEATVIYNNFIADITFNFENMKNPYDISEETFRPTFESCLEELGISKGLIR